MLKCNECSKLLRYSKEILTFTSNIIIAFFFLQNEWPWKGGRLRRVSWLFFHRNHRKDNNYFAGNCETFQHAKAKWPQIFLFHRQDHKKMLMASENEWMDKWSHFSLMKSGWWKYKLFRWLIYVGDLLSSVRHRNQRISTIQSNTRYSITK